MRSDDTEREFARQIETYSNAIVAFAVLQSLAYSYAFGTSELFNCLVKTANYLAFGLSCSFVLVTALMVFAIGYLGRALEKLSGELAGTVRKIYRAKIVAVIVASAMPVALTVGYGILDQSGRSNCIH